MKFKKTVKELASKFNACSLSTKMIAGILLVVLVLIIPILLYWFYKTLVILFILVILGFIYFFREELGINVNNQLPKYTLLDNYDVVTDCVFDGVVILSNFFGLGKPSNPNALKSPQFAPDRLVYSLHKNGATTNASIHQLRDALNQEINSSFLKNKPKFLGDLSGLYIDSISDKNHCYEITIIPINNFTWSTIQERERYFRSLQQPTIQGDDLYDEEL